MARQSLAELLVKFSANSAELVEHTKKSREELSAFGKTAKEIGDVVKTVFAYEAIKQGAEALYEWVKAGAEAGEKLSILSQKVGVSVEEMSRLDFAAKQVGSSGEAFAGAMVRLSKNMAETEAGTGKASKAFAALGIDVTDSSGNLRSSMDVMGDVAEQFAGMENGAGKTALAVMLFGRAGADMIPFLNEGREGVAALMAESDKLGKTMSGEVAEGAKQFEDDVKKLQGGSTLLAASVAAQLAPAFDKLIETWSETGNKAQQTATAAETIAMVIKGVASGVMYAAAGFEMLGTRIGGFAAAVAATARGEFSLASKIREMTEKDIDAIGEKWDARIGSLWGKGTDDDAAAMAAGNYIGHHEEKKRRAPGVGGEDSVKEYEKSVEKLNSELTKLQQHNQTAGLGQSAALIWSIQYGELAKTIAAAGAEGQKLKTQLLAEAGVSENIKGQIEAGKKGEEAWKALSSELERAQLGLIKVADGTERSKVEWELAHGALGKYVQTLRETNQAHVADWYVGERRAAAEATDAQNQANAAAAELERLHAGALRDAERVLSSMAGPAERYAEELERINRAHAEPGGLTDAQYAKAMVYAKEKFEKAGGVMYPTTKRIHDDLQSGFTSAFENIDQGFGKVAEGMAETFSRMLKKMVAEALASNLLGLIGLGPKGGALTDFLNGITGGGGVGTPGGLDVSGLSPVDAVNEFGGMGNGLAGGGNFGPNELHWVGERGPELLATGSASGTVIPNSALTGAGAVATGRQVVEHVHKLDLGDSGHMTLNEWYEDTLAREAANR